MADLSFIAALLFWTAVPGLLVLRALRVPWSGVEQVAAAGGLSIAVVSALAYGASAVGVPLAPLPVAVVLVAVTALLRAVDVRRSRIPDDDGAVEPWWSGASAGRWMPWLVLVLPLVVVRQLEPLWSAGLLVPPTLHDGLDHAMWFRLVLDAQTVMPSEVMAPPLNPDGSAGFYPWGLHAWLALVAGSGAVEPMTAFFRGLVAVSALLPLAVYVFAARFLGRGWPAMAAAALSLVFWWLPYQAWGWGGHAMLAGAVAALPISMLAIEAVRRRRAAWLVAATLAGIGLLLVHPSQAMAALLICAAVSATAAASHAGQWRAAAPFLVTLGLAAVALSVAGPAWAPLESFLARSREIGAGLAGNSAWSWPGGAYANAVWQLPDVWRACLYGFYAIGAIVAARHRALRPILAVHLVFSVMIPLSASQTWLTSFWYHAPERIWYQQYACLPLLGALGIGGLVRILGRALPGSAAILRPSVLWVVMLAVFLGGVRAGYGERATNFLRFFANRTQPPLPADPRFREDFAWISGNVPAGEVLFNASADWGLSVPFTGHRTVFWSGGYAVAPDENWHQLQAGLNRGDPHTAFAARELASRGVHYVYAAEVDPRLAVNGRERLQREPLLASVALEPVYASDTGAVFRVRPAGGVPLGLVNSADVEYVEGFWRAESDGARAWRWTNGRGVIRILPPAGAAPGCAVRLLGPAPDTYTVRANGVVLPLTPFGHRLPDALDAAQDVTIEILSSAANPSETDPAADDRLLGVRVYDITLECALSETGGAPTR